MKYLFIDLSSIAYPAWHVSQDHPDPNETSTRVLSTVRTLAARHGNVGVAICCDGGRSFRVDLDPAYKGNREEHDARLGHQIARTRDLLVAEGFPVWMAPTFEADDVIASATARALQDPESTVTIATADKDLLQLVSERVGVQSVTTEAVLDPTAVKAKFGVWPDQMLDYLSLVGDASDNIHGAARIGPKTAAALLERYTNLETIYERLKDDGEVPGTTRAQRAALIEFAARWPVVRRLLTLRTDVPLQFEEILQDRSETCMQPPDQSLPNSPKPSDWLGDWAAIAQKVKLTEVKFEPNVSPPLSSEVATAAQEAEKGIAELAPVRLGGLGENIGMPLPTVQTVPTPTSTTAHEALIAAPATMAAAPLDWERQLEPSSMSEAKALAADLFASRLFSAYGHPAAVLSTILSGRELGLPAMSSLRAFHIIEGKPAFAADFMRALVLRSGLAEFFRCRERTTTHCTFETKRKGDEALQSLTYTIDDAKRAWPRDDRAWQVSGWGRHPADMLVARAGTKLARLVYPDVFHGLYCPEEFD